MEQLKSDVRKINKALFGDPDSPKQPGVVQELMMLDNGMKQLSENVSAIRGDIKRAVWMVIGAVLTAVLAMVLKH